MGNDVAPFQSYELLVGTMRSFSSWSKTMSISVSRPMRARPVPGGPHGAADDVRAVVARQQELGQPRSFEWIADCAPWLWEAAAEAGLELADRALDIAGACANRARHPVHGAQLVDDLALDPGHGVRLELHVAGRVVPLDRLDQAEEAVRHEVTLVDVGGQPGAESACDVLHERRIRKDQTVAERHVRGLAVLQPETVRGVGPAHTRTIRRFRPYSGNSPR